MNVEVSSSTHTVFVGLRGKIVRCSFVNDVARRYRGLPADNFEACYGHGIRASFQRRLI